MSSPTDRGESPFRLTVLAAVGLGACCAIPLLLAAGASVTIAGLGIGNWALLVAGLSAAMFAIIWNRRKHQEHECVSKEPINAG